MALKYVGKLITDTQVFAMSEGITTTTVNVPKKWDGALKIKDGETERYIVLAGTPWPSNDKNGTGIIFENWDVTENGGPIPVALSGTINEVNASAIGVNYSRDFKSTADISAHFRFLGETGLASSTSPTLSVEPQITLDDLTTAGKFQYKVTLSGGKFIEDEVKKTINWICGLPSGFYLSLIEYTMDNEIQLDVEPTSLELLMSKPAQCTVTFNLLSAAIENGDTPGGGYCNLYKD